MGVLALPRLGPVDATVTVPGSKSIANRALVCSALATGTSTLSNAPDGDDTTAMLAALEVLGCKVTTTAESVGIIDVSVDPAGVPIRIANADDLRVHAKLAGTTSRFVTALAALGSIPITIDGEAPLRQRPFGPLHDALTQIGVKVDPVGPSGHLPVTVTGPPTNGSVQIRGDVTSQFISALMMIGPYLPGGLTLQLTSPLVSRPYVDLTATVMALFGLTDVDIATSGPDRTVRVSPGAYRATVAAVEADASSASYPMAIAAVAGGRITVSGLGSNSHQGDAAFANLLASMGCDIEQNATDTTVARPPDRKLVGIDVDMADISDLVPTVAAVALFATTPTRIRGVDFIRHKESDRLGDLATEFAKLGAEVAVTDDGLIIEPAAEAIDGQRGLHGGVIDPHHDHRLAMAAGVVAAGVVGVAVDDPLVVSKSWPGFWAMREGLA